MYNGRFYNASSALIELLVANTGIAQESFTAISFIAKLGGPLPFSTVVPDCLHDAGPAGSADPNSHGQEPLLNQSNQEATALWYRVATSELATQDGGVAVIEVVTPWDPLGDNAQPWIKKVEH